MKRSGFLKRSGPLRKVSKKRRKVNKAYSLLRAGFLQAFPICGRCEKARATDIHHKAKRGANLLNTETWMPACRSCHDWIHSHQGEAREQGFLR